MPSSEWRRSSSFSLAVGICILTMYSVQLNDPTCQWGSDGAARLYPNSVSGHDRRAFGCPDVLGAAPIILRDLASSKACISPTLMPDDRPVSRREMLLTS